MNPEAAAQDTKMVTSSLPSTWPGAFGIYKSSRDAIRRNIWLLVELWVVYFAVLIVFSVVAKNQVFVGNIITTVVGLVFTVILTKVILASARGKHVTASELLDNKLPMLSLKLFGLYFVVGVLLCASFLAFIVPFFFVYPRLILATYYVIDKNMGVFGAVGQSWHDTKGNAGKVWGVLGVSFLMSLLMITIIGIPFAIYLLIMYGAAQALLYLFISESHASQPAQEASVSPAAELAPPTDAPVAS